MSALGNWSIASIGVGAGTEAYDPRADNLTIFARNVLDAVHETGAQCPTAPNCTVPGTYTSNLIGHDSPFDIRAELRDPYHRDFRPCPGSTVARLGAGAYAPYDPAAAVYRVPGRRLRGAASAPVPPSGSVEVHLDSELMFRPAVRALGHAVYFGRAGDTLVKIVDLAGGEANVARPAAAAMLQAHTHYEWRVDVRGGDGAAVRGTVWKFATGANVSCHITPRPPAPAPPAPGPAACAAAEAALCPGLAGGGAKVGEPCYQCVTAHSKQLEDAGCWSAATAGSGGRSAAIKKFCCPPSALSNCP